MKTLLSKWTYMLATVAFVTSYAAMTPADTGDPNVHQDRQTRPIPLGVSGINRDDFCFVRGGNFVICSTGTLGSLVQDAGGTMYILSNNHILGIINNGVPGDDVIQPGYLDDCFNQNPEANVVADLTEFVPLDFTGADNLVDAGIAQIRAGQVNTSGTILDIGTVSSTTAAAFVGQAVKKSGRTTGLTTGNVSAINVTVNVGYQDCGAKQNETLVGHFVNQIEITPGSFSAGGDSGSLIVESATNQAVGLLFAGSSVSTIANTIDAVLCEFSFPLAMAGGTPACPGGCTLDGDCALEEICCGGTCTTAVCSADGDCNDADACTVDTCSNGGTCNATCSNTDVACGPADGCCPPGCDSTQDSDCPAGQCGDGVCAGQAGGEDCFTCQADCKCKGPGCSKGCCGDGVCLGENANNCPVDCASGTVGGRPLAADRLVTSSQAGAIKRRHSAELLAIPDVVGHGISLSANGTPVIVVYLSRESAAARAQIQPAIDGVPTRIKLTGPFTAFGCK